MTEHANSGKGDATVGIVGGGLGGLAAACTLAARGHRVILYEANSWVGGKAAVLREQGFRFDMGPTILTLPQVLRRIFVEAGRRLTDFLEIVRLDPQWRCIFADQSVLDLSENTGTMAARIGAFSRAGADDGGGYHRFMELSQRLREISDRFFFWKPIGSIRDMMDAKASFNLKTLSDVMAMRLGRSVTSTIRSCVTDPRVVQMLEHFTQYVGSWPDASPAVLCGIARMQTGEGVWYPLGGTGAVPEALRQLAVSLGVDVRINTPVKRITTSDGVVTGVELSNGVTEVLDAVVSNMDGVRTYRELVGGEVAAKFNRRRRYEAACSGVVLYLGLNKAYDHLLHHNFIFSRNSHEEFQSIYRDGRPAPDPTCYVCAPARTDPAVAPAGGEALYVLVHTPYLRPGHDWKKLFPEYRKTILSKLARTGNMPDIEQRIVFEQSLTPQDIQDRYHVLNGAIYGLASHGKWFGAFKPTNRSPDVKGLYLAGGAAHPGPGMPMVLMSGWIAADALDSDRRGTARADDSWPAAAGEERMANV